MTQPRFARIAGAVISKSRRDAPPPEPPAADVRARAIVAVQQAIAAKSRARRRARWIYGFAAAASVAGAVGIGYLAARSSADGSLLTIALQTPSAVLHGDGVFVVGEDAEHPGRDGSAVGRGHRLVVRPLGRAMLSFSTGTELALEERGDLTIVDQGSTQRFSLGAGSVQAKVAKLAPGQRFLIDTGDSEIEVRGTAFRVSVVPPDATCGEGTTTRVEVTEGTVVVRHGGSESRVSAGEKWPAGCEAPVVATTSIAAAPPAVHPPPPEPKKPAPPAATSRLGDQNDLFAQALAAKRSGAGQSALSLFDRFLAAYPSSPLAESAMAERMRLMRSRASAQQYLSRYPNGFAKAEAQALLEKP